MKEKEFGNDLRNLLVLLRQEAFGLVVPDKHFPSYQQIYLYPLICILSLRLHFLRAKQVQIQVKNAAHYLPKKKYS